METLNPITPTPLHERKLKNSFALIVLLAGLLVGSLFVDVGQLITHSGFSGSAIRDHATIEAQGKTWVAYPEPIMRVNVISDDTCEKCSPDEALVWLRRIMPTLSATKISATSFEGQALITQHHLLSLPAFVFESGIENTDFFAEAGPLFIQTGSQYFFDMNKIGLPAGKYLRAPEKSEGDIQLGSPNARVTVTVFSDFACQYCKEYQSVLKSLVSQYEDRVTFVFKHVALPTHPTATGAALAASCAQEQGAFLPYADLLFDRQNEWMKTGSQSFFLGYARRLPQIKLADFNRCLNDKRYQSVIDADNRMAEEYQLQAAPATFVGTEFVSGAAPQETVAKLIDEALATNQGQ